MRWWHLDWRTMLVVFAIAIVLVWTVVPVGGRGDLRGICEAISYGLFGVTLLCLGAARRECRKLTSIDDPVTKSYRERKIVRGVACIYIGLAASFPIGYLIGVRMLR